MRHCVYFGCLKAVSKVSKNFLFIGLLSFFTISNKNPITIEQIYERNSNFDLMRSKEPTNGIKRQTKKRTSTHTTTQSTDSAQPNKRKFNLY